MTDFVLEQVKLLKTQENNILQFNSKNYIFQSNKYTYNSDNLPIEKINEINSSVDKYEYLNY